MEIDGSGWIERRDYLVFVVATSLALLIQRSHVFPHCLYIPSVLEPSSIDH
jgi:hypothetical protein